MSRRPLALCAAFLLLPVLAEAAPKKHRLTAEEERLFHLIRNHPTQGRAQMKLDPILCLVARQRAMDMGRRRYFDHVNPSGAGPNFLVTRAGYRLPAFYDASKPANNIESIAARSPRGGPAHALAQWLNSPPHRSHTMAESDFARSQTRIGVGIAQFTSAPLATYYVFISAPPNGNPRPPQLLLLSSKGKVIARTR